MYLDRFSQVSSGGRTWLEHDSHHSRAVLRDDVAIGLAWGLTENDTFEEDWTTRFPDPKASSAWLEVLYHGQPVDRELMVHVDGRCYVPRCHSGSSTTSAPTGRRSSGLRVTRWQHHVVVSRRRWAAARMTTTSTCAAAASTSSSSSRSALTPRRATARGHGRPAGPSHRAARVVLGGLQAMEHGGSRRQAMEPSWSRPSAARRAPGCCRGGR